MKAILLAIIFTQFNFALSEDCHDKNSAYYKLHRIEILAIKAKLYMKNEMYEVAESLIVDIDELATSFNLENESKTNFCRAKR